MTTKVGAMAVQNFNLLDRFANKANARTLFESKGESDTVSISDEAKKKHVMGQLIASFKDAETSKKPY